MSKYRGFTILELLVAMAVFAALAALAFSILNQVSTTAQSNESRVRVASAFRSALDRLGADWKAAIFNQSHAPVIEKTAGNDSFRLFSHARAPRDSATAPRLSEVEYRITPLSNTPSGPPIPSTLHRMIRPVAWDETPGTPVTVPDGEPLAEGIFRLEMAFLTDQGQLTNVAPSDISSVRALVVAVAALDPKSLGRLDQDQLDELATALADASNDETPMQNWSPGDFDRLPAFVRQNVHFSQRFYFLQ